MLVLIVRASFSTSCDLGGTQTHDTWIRNPMLFSAELQGHSKKLSYTEETSTLSSYPLSGLP